MMALKWTRRGILKILGFMGATSFTLGAYNYLKAESKILLPEPSKDGEVSVERAIAGRRSVRRFESTFISLNQLSQLLWAAQGITDSRGFRAAPSAGALYPLELFILVGKVEGLKEGVYHYDAEGHSLEPHREGDLRLEMASASTLNQIWVKDAPIILVICAIYERTASQYGARGERYVHMEAGHVGENIYLQVESLGLACTVIGAFLDDEVRRILDVGEGNEPLYLIPIGKPS
ncbi:MAG: SagB/ThcOx family dehydrogenase [Methanocellales archaeon]|nr:SagB/ThcOx family dehydrogenase [Methanocellales archaeon]MDD3421550.1 SagB/ThcOx family dehydrogenase [Methanocellales archaeon]MDD4898033.1 SagB/ThcOx family dehydrogenase [Methanocellales archaeon]MDD5446508.1 SagB/ThcOx family dehydrogenase [Methanocellales archaeon]